MRGVRDEKTRSIPPKRGGTITLTYNRKDQEGKTLCCVCAHPVPKGRRHWCSEECVKRYRDDQDWGYIRQRVIQRDENECQKCGLKLKRDRKTIHHIIPVEKGGTNQLDNLILLCESCHLKVHGKEI